MPPHRPPLLRAAAAVLFALAALATCAREPPVSATRRLVDRSSRLAAQQRARVERYLRFVRAERGIDCRVVLAGEGDRGAPEDEAEHWFRKLAVGSDDDGRGLLLWLDAGRRLARIEVAYALEGVVPDLSAAWILEAYVGPHARGDELAAGIEAAIEGLVDRVAPRRAELAEAAASAGSGGAGARSDLAAEPAAPVAELDLAPRPDPRSTRELELAMLRAGRYEQEAAIYDEAWRRARRGRWTPARLREIARRFDRPYEIATEGDHAVAYYPAARDLGPTLLRREAAGWIIDASAGARLVVYDYSNERWYLVDEPSPYVALLRGVYRLERGRLGDGRPAWWIAPAGG